MPSFSVGRVRPVYKGQFDPAAAYGPLERVAYQYALYESVRDVPAGTDPSLAGSLYWVQISAEGAQGPEGPQGPMGPQGPAGETMPISDSVTSADSGVAASSLAVKTAYAKGVEALSLTADVSVPNAVSALGYASTAKGLGQIGPAVHLDGSAHSIDDYLETGVFYFSGGRAPVGWPLGVNGWLFVDRRPEFQTVLQRVYRTSWPQYAFRMKANSEAAWTPWLDVRQERLIWASANITGTSGAFNRSYNFVSCTRNSVGSYSFVIEPSIDNSGTPLIFIQTASAPFVTRISSVTATSFNVGVSNPVTNTPADANLNILVVDSISV